MSQHFFTCVADGKKVSVMLGWDRPLQGFFMVVEDVGVQDDSYIYDNLSDPNLFYCNGLPGEIDYFLGKLKELGLRVPDLMIGEVLRDKAGNMGNRFVRYDANGEMVERSS